MDGSERRLSGAPLAERRGDDGASASVRDPRRR